MRNAIRLPRLVWRLISNRYTGVCSKNRKFMTFLILADKILAKR